MSNSKIHMVIDYLLKNKTQILVTRTIARTRNELIKETITSLILNKINELEIPLTSVSEIRISLTKNKGTEKERGDNDTIDLTTIERPIDIEMLSKHIGDIVYQLLKPLSFKPTIALKQ